MLSWSGVMADMQSENCRSNKAPAANVRNSLLPIMLIQLYRLLDGRVKNSARVLLDDLFQSGAQ